MLSDSCFQMIDDLLQAVTDYDYSDDYFFQLIEVIKHLNEIRDDLDMCGEGTDLLKNNEGEGIIIAAKMLANAKKRRTNSSLDVWEGIYDSN